MLSPYTNHQPPHMQRVSKRVALWRHLAKLLGIVPPTRNAVSMK